MDEAYEDGVKATVKQHVSNLHDVLREAINCNDEEFAERGYVIEEVGRFMNYLSDRDEDEVITAVYHDGLNYFETLKEKGE